MDIIVGKKRGMMTKYTVGYQKLAFGSIWGFEGRNVCSFSQFMS